MGAGLIAFRKFNCLGPMVACYQDTVRAISAAHYSTDGTAVQGVSPPVQ